VVDKYEELRAYSRYGRALHCRKTLEKCSAVPGEQRCTRALLVTRSTNDLVGAKCGAASTQTRRLGPSRPEKTVSWDPPSWVVPTSQRPTAHRSEEKRKPHNNGEMVIFPINGHAGRGYLATRAASGSAHVLLFIQSGGGSTTDQEFGREPRDGRLRPRSLPTFTAGAHTSEPD